MIDSSQFESFPTARVTGARGLLLAVAIAAGGSFAAPAVADTVTPTVLKSASTLVYSNQSNTYDFSVPAAGTVDVTLQNVAWPQRLSSLTASIFSASSVLGSMSASGATTSADMQFAVSGPLQLAAFVTAQAQGSLDLGLYSLDVTFSPAAVPVPLPATGMLLLGGSLLGVLGWRRRSDEYPPERIAA